MRRGRKALDGLDAEIQDHIERETRDNIAQGMTPSEARRLAMLRFGNVGLVKEDTRAVWTTFLEQLVQDIRYAVRALRQNPGYTAVAALSLALAIGANTATFSLVNALLLRDLPVARPHELLELGRGEPGGSFSYPLYLRIRDEETALSGILAVSKVTVRADGFESDRRPIGRFVSGSFFEVLGIRPAAGRAIAPADDRLDAAGSATVAVLTHSLWRREFGSDPDVVGTTLRIDSVAFTVVGVLPREFTGLVVGRPDDFYLPIASEPLIHRRSWLGNPAFNWLAVVGRFDSGTGRTAARASLDVAFARAVEDLAANAGGSAAGSRVRAERLAIESARTGLSAPRRELAQPVLLLMGAVGLVLVIASTNVVHLLMTRGMARRREIGLRLAVGASRGRLIRQLMTEAAALGVIGGALGLALATWGTRLIAATLADGDPAIGYQIAPDKRLLLFTLVVSLGSALAAGAMPAIRASRAAFTPGHSDGALTRGPSRAAGRGTRVLIAGQVALSLVLVSGAWLVVASLRNLRTFDAGFDRTHVLLLGLSPGRGGIAPDRRLAYYRHVLDRIRNTPGVEGAGVSLITPISGGSVDQSFGLAGQPFQPNEPAVMVNEVSDGYFAAMGTPLRLGRDFTERDDPNSAPVALINDALARRYFTGVDPIGQRVRVGPHQEFEVVGVVTNAKYLSLREEDRPTVYLDALQQRDDRWGYTLALRTSGDPARLAPVVRREVESVAATVPVAPAGTLAAQVDRSLFRERLMTRILGAFAALALLLAAVGLYGVLSYTVAQRTKEIGIRLALGADRRTVWWSIVRESGSLVVMGVAIGVLATVALTRLLANLLYGVTATDPWVLAGATVSLFLVALIATSQPAWRAVRVDPLIALRE